MARLERSEFLRTFRPVETGTLERLGTREAAALREADLDRDGVLGNTAPEREAAWAAVDRFDSDRDPTSVDSSRGRGYALARALSTGGDAFDVPPAEQAGARAGGIPAKLVGDALGVLNTTRPERVTVNGVGIDVYGATAGELETIRNTLSRLPASHLRTIPRIVVADTVAHGNRRTGGGSHTAASIASYERRARRSAEAYRAEGWQNLPRLELTHESLGRPQVVRQRLSPTLLHETGHAVDAAYRLSGGMSPESLGEISYGGVHRSATDPRGPVMERFADAYMHYYLGNLERRDPTAYQTVSAALERIEP